VDPAINVWSPAVEALFDMGVVMLSPPVVAVGMSVWLLGVTYFGDIEVVMLSPGVVIGMSVWLLGVDVSFDVGVVIGLSVMFAIWG